jgi:Spx/MgsR family transcriptional regulator
LITLYGIKNCDGVKKARRWLDANGILYTFHDFRSHGLEPCLLDSWLQELGWQQLLNRRGTTWRLLPEQVRGGVDAGAARQLMLDNPVLIKRPLLDLGDERRLGFDESMYQQFFSARAGRQ